MNRFVFFVLCSVSTAVAAQQSAPAFEVASVKPNKSDSQSSFINTPRGGGNVAVVNMTPRLLIEYAFRIRPFQLIGGPSWISSDRFDVAAKAPENSQPAEILLMLQRLLADRFRLRTHSEMREQPVYSLIVARSDGRLGPQLRRSAADCVAAPATREQPQCDNRTSINSSGDSTILARGRPISIIASTLGNVVDRAVLDRTGLTGTFDFDLRWSMAATGTSADTVPPSETPSIFTALQEQLGLKLEPSRGPVDVLVIDSVERPKPD